MLSGTESASTAHPSLALGLSCVGTCWVSLVPNLDMAVLRPFDPIDPVLLLLRHFCVEGLCLFPGGCLFLSVRLQAGCAPRGFHLPAKQLGQKGDFTAGLRTLVEKKGYLALEGGSMFALASLGPRWGL